MTPFMWAALLLVVAVALLFFELLIPSGGLLGVLAASSLVASMILVFYYGGLTSGTIYLVIIASISPFIISAALRWWPHTPMGRMMLNLPPGSVEDITSAPQYDAYLELVGKRGVATSKMLPSGAVSIEDQSYDAVSQAGAIEAGQAVEVADVKGNRILVRPVDNSLPKEPTDELSRPVEEIVSDPFEDPLA